MRFFTLSLLLSFVVTIGSAESAVTKDLSLSAAFSSSPLVLKTTDGEKQVLKAGIESQGLKNLQCRISAEGWDKPVALSLGDIAAGKQELELPIPVSEKEQIVTVQFLCGEEQKTFTAIPVSPLRKWMIYLNQHTHTDIGYTKPQTEILSEHLRYIDYALDYCDLTDSYPDDAKFRWTCETSWAVREYIKRRPADQIARLKKRIQEGRIELAGMLLNMAETADEGSLAALLQPVRAIKEELNVSVVTAMQNDVNGAAWCLPDYFAGMGIKYLTMGINKTRSLLPFDKPTAFWWESPSGKRIIANRPDHYHTGNEWHIEQGDIDKFKPGCLNYLQTLEKKKYVLDRIAAQFSGYRTDNSPPSTAACTIVKTWNERYAWPKLRLSTAHEFLEWVEKEQADKLPVYRAAWPDWWTDGFGSAARETAASRDVHTSMLISQSLLSIASLMGAQPDYGKVRDRINSIQEDVLFYDEHTYGAAESISDPLAENTQVQWAEKGSYVWNAVKNSYLLREEAFGLLQDYLPKEEHPSIAVFNTLNWKRSGLVRVFIDHQILPTDKEFRIVDRETNQAIPAQKLNSRTEGTYWSLWVNDVPPMGYKMLRIEVEDKARPKTEPLSALTSLENSYYKLDIDSQKGLVKSLVDKETGKELVDASAEWGLGQCIYETMPDVNDREFKRDAFKRTSLSNVSIRGGDNGPIWKSVFLSGSLAGCAEKKALEMEIRLYETEKKIEFLYAIRKLPVTAPEAVYVAFPFQLPDFKTVYEAQGGYVTPGDNQIPGSASDWQTMQNFVAFRNPEGQIIYGSSEAPLVQLGDFNLGKWQEITSVKKPTIYSWVMNNYWFTNFRVSQEGEFKWSYYLTSSKDASNAYAVRFSWGSRVPMAARILPPGKSNSEKSTSVLSSLDIDVPNILVVEAKPDTEKNSVILHLREMNGKPVTISQEDVTSSAQLTGAEEVNVLGETLESNINSLSFKPYEAKFLRIRFEP